MTLEQLIESVTQVTAAPFCPELSLHLAAEPIAPWAALEARSGKLENAPFWAHAWPGGVALARYVLDTKPLVAGKRVLDFASGCGVSAIAAAKAGAARVVATEVDDAALAAIAMNARLNGVAVECLGADVIGRDDGWDVVLVGDVFYRDELSRRVEAWLRTLHARGAMVLIGDPGRTFLPVARLEALATVNVPPVAAWDSVLDRPARVWGFALV